MDPPDRGMPGRVERRRGESDQQKTAAAHGSHGTGSHRSQTLAGPLVENQCHGGPRSQTRDERQTQVQEHADVGLGQQGETKHGGTKRETERSGNAEQQHQNHPQPVWQVDPIDTGNQLGPGKQQIVEWYEAAPSHCRERDVL